MRSAKASDYWRKLAFNPPKSTRLRKLRFSNSNLFGSGNLEFDAPIIGICGGNGSGKTTLLSILYQSLGKDPIATMAPIRLNNDISIDEIEINFEKQTINCPQDISRHIDDYGIDVHMIDGASQASTIRYLVERDQNFNDFLEQTSPKNLGEVELEEISYLVGKSYSKCQIYEISEYAEYDTFPYFEVTSDNIDYRSEGMGKGELAALLTYWYIKQAKNESIILLEEPEAHLPVRTQCALMNILAMETLKKNLFTVISTHSAYILEKINKSNIRIISKVKGEVKISKDVGTSILNDMFGIKPWIKAILLVEDNAAKYFLRTLFDSIRPEISMHFDIAAAGSDGKVLRALRNFPSKELKSIKIAGVLDGDLKNNFKLNKNESIEIFFLPGETAPELEFKKINLEKINELSSLLNTEENTVHIALAHITGEDHHDWLSKFANLVDKSYRDVCIALTRLWLAKPINCEKSSSLIMDLEKLISTK